MNVIVIVIVMFVRNAFCMLELGLLEVSALVTGIGYCVERKGKEKGREERLRGCFWSISSPLFRPIILLYMRMINREY